MAAEVPAKPKASTAPQQAKKPVAATPTPPAPAPAPAATQTSPSPPTPAPAQARVRGGCYYDINNNVFRLGQDPEGNVVLTDVVNGRNLRIRGFKGRDCVQVQRELESIHKGAVIAYFGL